MPNNCNCVALTRNYNRLMELTLFICKLCLCKCRSMLCVSLVIIQMGRRESLFGRVPPVVEVPSVKQRRNSLSIPFFSHPAPKQGEGTKLLDDSLPVSLVVMVTHATLTTNVSSIASDWFENICFFICFGFFQ